MPTLESLRTEHQLLIGWFKRARNRILVLENRLEALEQERTVLVVDELPPTAPAHTLLREKQTGNLYLGNGPSQPLSRFVPSP